MNAWKAAALAMGTVLTASVSYASSDLTVVVFDYAGTPHEILSSAIKASRDAFHTAGIETDWILCHPTRGCSVPDQYAEVKIMPHPLSNTPLSPDGLAETIVCKQADHCAASYIFFDRAFDFARGLGVPLDLTMGYVMAHEIGHLMGLGHRAGGIMAAAFNAHDLESAALGRLCFGPQEVRQLRAAVARPQIAGNSNRQGRQSGIHTGAAE